MCRESDMSPATSAGVTLGKGKTYLLNQRDRAIPLLQYLPIARSLGEFVSPQA
jgi:hypothetical protein